MIQHRQHGVLEKRKWSMGDIFIVTGLSFIIMLSSMIVYNMISSRRKDKSRHL